MRFSWSTRLLMCLTLETLASIIRTASPILVELIDLVNYVTIFLSQTNSLRWLTFLLGSMTDSQSCSFGFLSFFWFVLQWIFFHWEILIILLSQFPLTFQLIYNRIPRFIAQLMTILVLIGMVFVIIWEIFHERISLYSVLKLLLVNFVSGFRLELMYISLIESIRSSLTHLHGFQQPVLLP